MGPPRKRKRYRSQGAFEPHDEIPQHQAEGVGPEETARLRALFDAGKLTEYCTKVLDPLKTLERKAAEAIAARRRRRTQGEDPP